MRICLFPLIGFTWCSLLCALPALANPGDKLDRSHLVVSFSEEFRQPLSFYDASTGKGTWKTHYFFGPQEGPVSRTLDEEREIFSDFEYNGINPFTQQNGLLTITVAKNPHPDDPRNAKRPYTSGMLTTERSFSQTYGFFEMRGALPAGPGLWPAFWLLSTSKGSEEEIDVMENLGKDVKTIFCSVHKKNITPPKNLAFPVPIDTVTHMHTYGVLWTPDQIVWYLDDEEVSEAPNPGLNGPMYLLASIAVGGAWGGYPDLSTRFPAQMLIEHIRAYQIQ